MRSHIEPPEGPSLYSSSSRRTASPKLSSLPAGSSPRASRSLRADAEGLAAPRRSYTPCHARHSVCGGLRAAGAAAVCALACGGWPLVLGGKAKGLNTLRCGSGVAVNQCRAAPGTLTAAGARSWLTCYAGGVHARGGLSGMTGAHQQHRSTHADTVAQALHTPIMGHCNSRAAKAPRKGPAPAPARRCCERHHRTCRCRCRRAAGCSSSLQGQSVRPPPAAACGQRARRTMGCSVERCSALSAPGGSKQVASLHAPSYLVPDCLQYAPRRSTCQARTGKASTALHAPVPAGLPSRGELPQRRRAAIAEGGSPVKRPVPIPVALLPGMLWQAGGAAVKGGADGQAVGDVARACGRFENGVARVCGTGYWASHGE